MVSLSLGFTFIRGCFVGEWDFIHTFQSMDMVESTQGLETLLVTIITEPCWHCLAGCQQLRILAQEQCCAETDP